MDCQLNESMAFFISIGHIIKFNKITKMRKNPGFGNKKT